MSLLRSARFLAMGVPFLLVAVANSAAASAAPVAEPVPPAGERVAIDRSRAQEPLRRAAQHLLDYIHGSDGTVKVQWQDWTGVAIEGNRVVVYWKGGAPSAFRTYTDGVARRHAITIDHVSTENSRTEVDQAGDRLSELFTATPLLRPLDIQFPVDGAELRVIVSPEGVSTSTAAAAVSGVGETAQGALEADPAQVAEVIANSLPDLGVEVNVVVEASETAAVGRYDITEGTLRGGGGIQSQEGVSCTSAFAIAYSGTNWMLTAGHCGYNGQRWRDQRYNTSVGTAAHENQPHDTLLIGGYSYSWRVWEGPGMIVNSSNVPTGDPSGLYTRDGVVRWVDAVPGMYTCVSGARTGKVCDVVVTDNFTVRLSAEDAFGNTETYEDLVELRQLQGRQMVQPGDSGGPVYSLTGWRNGDYQDIQAVGVISGLKGYFCCKSDRVFFQDMRTVSRDYPGMDVRKHP